MESAKVLLEAKSFRGANNRAYYAIFHAINAIHSLRGASYKKHKDALANFNKEYVYGIEIEREDIQGEKIINIEKESVDIISPKKEKVDDILNKLYTHKKPLQLKNVPMENLN